MRNKKSQVRTLFFRKILSKFELRRFFKSREILKKQAGFALIEVIVSMVILSLVLASAIGLLYSVGLAVEKNRDRLTATYLAQECLELVRNARDTAWRNYQPWDCAWENESSCSGISDILNNIKQEKVKIGDQKTKFSRKFLVEPVSEEEESSRESFSRTSLSAQNNQEVKVTCTVSWGESDKLSISEILTNWRKR